VVVDDVLHHAPAVVRRADVADIDRDRRAALGQLGLQLPGTLGVASVAGGH
jgi:hypothetical protein